jgi:hypothetical protein
MESSPHSRPALRLVHASGLQFLPVPGQRSTGSASAYRECARR